MEGRVLKFGYVLLDGCADLPVPSLNYTTPLEAAHTPNLDKISSSSKLGSVVTVGKGVAPESDIAVFSMLGYSFDEGYPGRGIVEAVGAGMSPRTGDLVLRANLASVRGRRIVDRRAGRNLTSEEGKAIARELNEIKLAGASLEFRSTVGYRGVLLIRADRPLSAAVTNTDPAYMKVRGFGAARETSGVELILESSPETGAPEAAHAARLVNEFTEKSLKVLSTSETNTERARAGKLPANCVLLRDAGDHLPDLVPFEKKYGVKGVALVEMPAEVGIAKLLGMKMVPIRDRNDLKEKASLFVRELKDSSLVYVHIKGPDEFGHEGDAKGKTKCIEAIDRDFFSALSSISGDFRLGVSCDHSTPCTLSRHSADPVPLLVTTPNGGDRLRFTERNSRVGSLGSLMGRDVLKTFVVR